jgi:hypothetical protein
MRRWWPLPVLLLLVFASGWILLTIVNATTSGDGHGGVFWTAIVMLVLIEAALLYGTWRVARRLRA